MRVQNKLPPSAALFLPSLTSSVFLLAEPRKVAEMAGDAVFLASLLGFTGATAFMLLSAWIASRHFPASPVELFRGLLGRYAGSAFLFSYALFFNGFAFFTLRSTTELVSQNLLRHTPQVALALPLLLIAAYLAVGGIEPITRLAAFSLPVLFPLISLFYLFSLSQADLSNLLPLWGESSPGRVLFAAYFLASEHARTGIPIMLLPYLLNPRGLVPLTGAGMAVAMTPFLLSQLASLAHLTARGVLLYNWPELVAVQMALPPGFLLEKLDFLFLLAWTFIPFMALGWFLHWAGEGWRQLFGLRDRRLTVGIASLLASLSLLPLSYHHFTEMYHYFILIPGGVFSLGFLLPLLLASLVRGPGNPGRRPGRLLGKATRQGLESAVAKPRRTLLGLLLFVLLLLSGGCWDYRDIEERAQVMGLGVDHGPRGHRVAVDIGLPPPGGAAGGTRGGGGQGMPPRSFILTADGPGIPDALSLARARWNKPLDFGHLGVLVIGEEAAREGVKEYLRCGGCHPEISTGILLAVAEGKAEDFLRYPPPTQELVSDYYMFLLRTAASTNLVPAEARLATAAARGEAAGVFLLPRLTRGRGLPRAEGAAVFEGYRLKGWLSARESQGVALLAHRKGRLVFAFPCPAGREEQPVSFSVHKRKLERKVRFRGEIPSFEVRIHLQGWAIDAGCQLPFPIAPPSYKEKIERAASQKALALAHLALRRQKELGVDFLGFGEEIRKRHPSRWRKLKGRWKEMVPRLAVEVKVKTTLERSGILR